MRSQTEDQVVRTVEIRSWGGRDFPQRRFVRVVIGLLLGWLLADIVGRKLWWSLGGRAVVRRGRIGLRKELL